ncbi:hypothetical protein [Aquimarina agarivorans]|uniref:hypothetical protein n=1 Tax=Aquimarina agarivorans TaxID=980584 RepID=UPI000248F5F2|nr:hypothetical protein [Aquimarina agarivorans]
MDSIKFHFLITIFCLFFYLNVYSQQNEFIGLWRSQYEEWSYDVENGDCCGIYDIPLQKATFMKVTKDSIFYLKNNKIVDKAAYIIQNDKKNQILESNIGNYSFFRGGIESSGRGLCDDWIHYRKVIDFEKKPDVKKDLLNEIDDDIYNQIISNYLSTGNLITYTNHSEGYSKTILEYPSLITKYSYFDNNNQLQFELVMDDSLLRANSIKLDENINNRKVISRLNRVFKAKKIHFSEPSFEFITKTIKNKSCWLISWYDFKKQTKKTIYLQKENGKILKGNIK